MAAKTAPTPTKYVGHSAHWKPPAASKPAAKAPTPHAPAPVDPLAALTPAQITGQATRTINTAYQPQYTALNQAGKQATGLSSKRAADLSQYQKWLSTQLDSIQTQNNAASQALQGQIKGISDQQSALYAGQAPALVNEANARAGNVSNNAQSNSLGEQLGANQAFTGGLTAAAEQGALRSMDVGATSLGASRANAGAYMGSLVSKNQSDLQTSLTNIANDRAKLKQAQTGDLAKEIARLGGVEIQKAQSNRDYQTAVEQLQLQGANIGSEITARTAAATTAARNATTAETRAAIDAKNADTAAWKANQSQANSDRSYQLDVQKYGDAVAKDKYLRDHGLGTYKPSKTGAKAPLGQASQNAIVGKIGKIQTTLRLLINQAGQSPVDAYHKIQRGGPLTIGTGTSARKITITAADDPQLLNAAYNTLGIPGTGTGLNAGDVNALLGLGLSYDTITGHYAIHAGGNPAGGNPLVPKTGGGLNPRKNPLTG